MKTQMAMSRAYELRYKMAYSRIGKMIAKVLQRTIFKGSRAHWIQQAFADGWIALQCLPRNDSHAEYRRCEDVLRRHRQGRM